MFASNKLWWAGAIRAGEPVPNPIGDGTQGIVDPRDVAAATAEVLTATGSAGTDHGGRTDTLTGPELLSPADQAAQLSAALGRPVELVDQSLDEARAALLAAHMEPAVVGTVIAGMGWARAGRNAVVTRDLADLVGRAPTRFAIWAHDHRDSCRA